MTKRELEEIKLILEDLRRSDKYFGHWDNNCLLLSVIVSHQKIIVPEIKVKIIEKQDDRLISVEFEIKYRFEIMMRILIVLLTFLEGFLAYYMITNRTFNIVSIAPLLFGIFVYFITNISYKWESDTFRYKLNKIIK